MCVFFTEVSTSLNWKSVFNQIWIPKTLLHAWPQWPREAGLGWPFIAYTYTTLPPGAAGPCCCCRPRAATVACSSRCSACCRCLLLPSPPHCWRYFSWVVLLVMLKPFTSFLYVEFQNTCYVILQSQSPKEKKTTQNAKCKGFYNLVWHDTKPLSINLLCLLTDEQFLPWIKSIILYH